MAEPPADTLRHAARRLRIDARACITGGPGEKWHNGFAKLLDAVAGEMGDYPSVKERDGGVGIEFLDTFQPSPIWTAALAAARAYLSASDTG